MLTFSKIFFAKLLFFVALNPNLETKVWEFTLISRRKGPEARAAGVIFVLSKNKNTYMNVRSQTDLYPKAEEKQEVQKYRINSNLGNIEIHS